MDEFLFVENVRCFREAQDIRLRPLTILIGENSSGKSTLLALTRAAYELSSGLGIPEFNRDPFYLGGYEQLAHYHGGQGKRALHFTIGYSRLITHRDHQARSRKLVSVRATFRERTAQPYLDAWRLEAEGYGMQILFPDDGAVVTVTTPSGKYERRVSQIDFALRQKAPFFAFNFLRLERDADKAIADKHLNALASLFEGLFSPSSYQAVAPVRSKPLRTYDPVHQTPGPEGAHVPFLLAEYALDADRWQRLRDSLHEFGEASGLFKQISVKRKGRKPSDPFQIHVGVGRFPFNLIDVGYGVSQVLPILVDALTTNQTARFLLQQPEVHLHPRAQAELGTFLAKLVRDQKLRFVVETHSDYLFDRIRTEVREGILPADAVQVLFCERDETTTQVKVHPLVLDAQGNLLEAPSSFRSFFLEEQRRFLGA